MLQAIEQFVADDYARAVAMVGLVTDEPSYADEGVQAAFVKVTTDERRYSNVAARIAVVASGETRQIARREINDAVAERDVPPHALASPPLVQDSPIAGAIRELPQRRREIVLLHFYLEASVAEIAEVAYINESTVIAHIDQARQTIADYLVSASDEADE